MSLFLSFFQLFKTLDLNEFEKTFSAYQKQDTLTVIPDDIDQTKAQKSKVSDCLFFISMFSIL